jgi:nucleoid DNA-binding protein
MDILFHLREFLQSHKTVGIDGLGTFYKKKSPGKYDVDTHSFLPPSTILAFGVEVIEPENFINFIAETANVDHDAAKFQINKFVEKIHTQLNDQQEFVLNDFGKFILANDKVNFVPSEGNFGNEFYGLPILPEINQADKEVTKVEEVEAAPIVQKEIDTPVSQNEFNNTFTENKRKFAGKPYTPNYDYDDDSDGEMSRPVKILLRTLLTIAIIAAIVGLAYFFKPDYFDRIIKSDDVETIPTTLPMPIDTANQVNEQINPDTAITANPDTTVVAKPQPKITESDITTYEVIGSAEKNQKRIDLVINTMKKRGIEAKALEGVPGKLVKISLGSFTDFNLAKKYQDSLRKKLNNSEIYIQTIKPKK